MKKQVLGIDPAPSKKSTVYDGQKFHHFPAKELRSHLSTLKKEVLICWDAPLTGPADLDAGSFSMRGIEKTLGAEIRDAKVEGVSVLPYSGCSHWAISRSILGLPRVGEYDSVDIPFPLTYSKNFSGSASVEVHPAVAMYYWLDNDFKKYKGSLKAEEKRKAVLHNFKCLVKLPALKPLLDPDTPLTSDDELDAFVAYALGYLWLQGEDVFQLGNEQTGAMLLPDNKKLKSINLPTDDSSNQPEKPGKQV